MAYVSPDYKSKKDFIEAVKTGKQHETYNPSGMFPTVQNTISPNFSASV